MGKISSKEDFKSFEWYANKEINKECRSILLNVNLKINEQDKQISEF